MGDDHPIRPVDEPGFEAFARVVALQFSETISDERIDVLRATTELDRTLAWFEGDRIMGTAETISFAMGVPGGGTAPCAGLTSVGVNPLRRRRGILGALMRRQLDDAHEREEPFGALYASESRIYGRYGYGAAVPMVSVDIPTARARLRAPVEADGLELLDVDGALRQLPAIHDRALAGTPGMMSRSAADWQAFIGYDPADDRDGYTARLHVALGDRGYVIYRSKDDWDENAPDGRLRIVELIATDPDASAALWSLCLSMDLIARVEAPQQPPDTPILLALDDPARARVRAAEPLWLRLISVPDAIAARRYAGEGGAVVALRDASCPWNAGTWRLDLGPQGGAATRTDAEPDLALDVAELGATFLGGVRLSALTRARRVEERTAGAAAALDRLLLTDPLPWNPRPF